MSEAALLGILDDAVAAGVVPGGVIAVGDAGRPVLEHAFGRTGRVPAGAWPPVAVDTIYDVASLTKAVATALVTLRLVERGRLALDDEAARYVPGAPATLRQLLAHASGLPAWRPFHELATGEGSPRERIIALAAAEPVERPPGTASVYSDLGFIVLGAACERAGQARLDELAAELVFGPAGIRPFFVDLGRPTRPAAAPTELGVVPGEVHDENCRAAGGILGHAGLFATAGDLATLAAALLRAFHGDGALFPPALVQELFAPARVPGSTWRLGWDGPAPAGTQAGERWPKSGVGHMGFTGTSIWLDLARRRWVVLLTNRVHPTRDDQRIKTLRPAVHDAVVAMLDD